MELMMSVRFTTLQMLVLGSMLLLPCHVRAAQPPPAASKGIPSEGGRLGFTVKSDEIADDERRRGELPPSVYRVLSRRSVGRYILATSSLLGECAQVYTPAPLVRIAWALCSRFGSIGYPGRHGSPGQRKSSGFSYEAFMPPEDKIADDENPRGDVDPLFTTVPPAKYGRVSRAFVLRHHLGQGIGITAGSEEPLKGEKKDFGDEPLAKGFGDEPQKSIASAKKINRRRARPTSSAGSVFKSIGSLGRHRRNQGFDDTDLLSDSEGDDEYVVVADSAVASLARETAKKPVVGRNLVDADDTATLLINRLRRGEQARRDGRVRGRRKTEQ